MPNERITENIVRTMLKEAGYDAAYIDEQIPKNPRIQKLLKDASKSGKGRGKPEFIVSLKNDPETLIEACLEYDEKAFLFIAGYIHHIANQKSIKIRYGGGMGPL